MFCLALVVLPLVVSALVVPHDAHQHSVDARLPDGNWFHDNDHPVHRLFKREGSDGTPYPEVGTPAWSSAFPMSTPDVNQLPKAWVDALNAAVAANRIPNIPQSHNTPNTNPVYPSGNPNGPEICSSTYKCRITGDIWDAPQGMLGVGFDDGPLPATSNLVKFLTNNHEIATHFMIGVNILNNPQQFLEALNADHDIAVHTWTHPYMTTLSNLEIVAQLGWTMELIHNSSGGRVPKFWRPPYGDSDVRVKAIANEVFGLTTILWNQDTEDWSLGSQGGTTPQAINASMTQWLTGPKSPGLIILEHELNDQTIGAFISAYPVIKANGWQTISSAQIADGKAYRNADGSDSTTVVPADILLGTSSSTSSTTSPSSTSTTYASSSTSPGADLPTPSRSTSQTTTSGVPTPSPSLPSSALEARASCGLGWIFTITLAMVILS